MPADAQRLRDLMEKYLDRTVSRQELQELFDTLKEQDLSDWERIMDEKFEHQTARAQAAEVDWDHIFKQIIKKPKSSIIAVKFRWAAAAAIAGVLLAGSYFLFFNKSKPGTTIAQTKDDVAPGGNKAVLTLANGQQIILDSAQSGTIAKQGNAKISKTDSGKLTYTLSPLEKGSLRPDEAIAYNTLTTPRGGQYQLQLPDGSKVWLNAASSIKYPTAFAGKERLVEITGEAYFEVVHNAKMPFKVKAGDEMIEDIGTSFNVNAYADEPLKKTTLIEGAVKIFLQEKEQEIRLNPGDQIAFNIQHLTFNIQHNADLEQAIAWKNGYFHFKDASLEDLMRQIARWYDVDIEYRGTIPPRRFGGEISRNSNASEVLKILELSKVHFNIENKKITVMP